jgi:hypothetical protein
MRRPIQIGLGTRVAPLLDALGRFCEAEGLAVSELHSIQFLDDEVEVEVVIVRADGTRRCNTYPMVAVWGTPIQGTCVPLVVPP